MKNFISIVVLCLFCLLSINTPNAFSQESCPKTIEAVKKDKRYKLVKENLYEAKQVYFFLLCAYGKNGKLRYENPLGKTYKSYYESGKLNFEIPYVADRIEGIAKYYYESGRLQSEIPYIAGKAEGIGKGYYENGKLKSETPNVADRIEGIVKEYYESGRLKAETPYVASKIDGVEKEYYENGKLKAETPYVAYKNEGIFKHYNENGNMDFEISYENNLAVSGICYKKNGETRALTDKELADFRNGKSPQCD